MIEVKIKPVGTKICPVCGVSDFDMPAFRVAPVLNEHVVMKKTTTQIMSVITPRSSRTSTRMTSLF